MAEEIIVDNTSYKLYSFTGEIIDQNERSETRISGGGSYYRAGYLHVDPVITTVNNKKEFFLVNEKGQERHFRMNNISLPPMRVGHTVQVKWLIRENYERGPYVIVHNKTLGKYTLDENQVIEAMYAKEKATLSRWYSALLLLLAVGGVLFLGSLITFFGVDSFGTTLSFFVPSVICMIIPIKVLIFAKKLEKNVLEMKKELANTV